MTKGLLITLLWIAFSTSGFGQAKATLTGTVYDALGAVIGATKIIATDEKGNKINAVADDSGVYALELPFCQYLPAKPCKMAKYDISAEAPGFKVTVIKQYLFVPAYSKKMSLDIALDVNPIVD